MSAQEAPKEMAILGVFHFGKTNDMAAVIMENPLGEKRQAEIEILVDKLAQFQPDRILLEYVPQRDSFYLIRYQQYLAGEHELNVNERQQIGFRLAKKMGHRKVYGIDHRMDLPFDEITRYAVEHNKNYLMENLGVKVGNFAGAQTEKLKNQSLVEYLAEFNSLEMDQKTHSLYVQDILNFGDADDPAGARMTAAWYQRNLIILQNIDRITRPGEKVLIIIGAAHRAILRDFIEDRDDMEFVEIADFLRKK